MTVEIFLIKDYFKTGVAVTNQRLMLGIENIIGR